MKHGPFPTSADLPGTIQRRLPERAQDIFREAFNHSFDEHGDQEHAVRMAWGAVKRGYEEMPDGKWVASPTRVAASAVAPGTPIQRRAS